MIQPRVLVLRAPGTNCDEESAFAFERAGARAERLHIFRLREQPELLRNYQILCLPGGFSYGDDLGAGRILANQLRLHLAEELLRFKSAGKLILGICNGFQVLLKTPLLLPPDAEGPLATLTFNDCGHYQDRWVRLERQGTDNVFLQGIERLYLPVAHAEGKFVARNQAVLEQLAASGRLVLRYAAGENPNGSMGDVAGVSDDSGRVLGLMPHPERCIDPTHFPHWTRSMSPEVPDGLRLFQNAVHYFS